jgi:hypothetical protein
MTDEILVEKRKFDAILRRMIATKPTPFKEMVSQSKAKKRGKKKVKKIQKMGRTYDPNA